MAHEATTTPLMADYLSRDQLAKELRISVRTLNKWAVLRCGPPKVRIGSRCFYRRDAVRAWIEAGAARGAREAA